MIDSRNIPLAQGDRVFFHSEVNDRTYVGRVVSVRSIDGTLSVRGTDDIVYRQVPESAITRQMRSC